MTHASLFSGIGGFDLAAERAGFTNVFQVENNPWCLKNLEKNFPCVKRYGDITRFNAKPYAGQIDLLTGGFPCQPFSIANRNRKGKRDHRFLWPQMFRIIKEIRPVFVIGENVPGLIRLALDQVLADLESIGYTTEPFVIPACATNAPHQRDRVWIIAYSPEIKNLLTQTAATKEESKHPHTKDVVLPDTAGIRCQKCLSPTIANKEKRNRRRISPGRNYWKNKPGICRVADGVPHRMDRIRGLGNAIVPQIAETIIKNSRMLELIAELRQNQTTSIK